MQQTHSNHTARGGKVAEFAFGVIAEDGFTALTAIDDMGEAFGSPLPLLGRASAIKWDAPRQSYSPRFSFSIMSRSAKVRDTHAA